MPGLRDDSKPKLHRSVGAASLTAEHRTTMPRRGSHCRYATGILHLFANTADQVKPMKERSLHFASTKKTVTAGGFRSWRTGRFSCGHSEAKNHRCRPTALNCSSSRQSQASRTLSFFCSHALQFYEWMPKDRSRRSRLRALVCQHQKALTPSLEFCILFAGLRLCLRAVGDLPAIDDLLKIID